VDADLTEELLDLERAGWDSLCDGSGDEFYGALMAPDGLMILANGQIMTRDDVVAALAGAPPWSSYEITNARTLDLGAGVAMLVYVGTGHRSGSSDFVGVMTSVYRRTADGWQLALYQQTASAVGG
jgi:hypothetical protein